MLLMERISVVMLVLLVAGPNAAMAQFVMSATHLQFPETQVGAGKVLGSPQSPVLALTVTNTSSIRQEFNFQPIPASCPFVFGLPDPPCLDSLAAVEELQSYTSISVCKTLAPGQSCNISIYFSPVAARTLQETLVFLDTSNYPAQPPVVMAQVTISGTGVPAPLVPGTVRAIEYYNATLDHYFLTPLQDEISKLDGGMFRGWERTGYSFWVWPAGSTPPGSTPVCRFYGQPEAGLDSHFYSASPEECQAVISKFSPAWQLETPDLFDANLPNAITGICPSSTVPLHRLYNDLPSASHRYMVIKDLQWDNLVSSGWRPEGYGDTAAVMCLPNAVYKLDLSSSP